jgi:hypothetical protein
MVLDGLRQPQLVPLHPRRRDLVVGRVTVRGVDAQRRR